MPGARLVVLGTGDHTPGGGPPVTRRVASRPGGHPGALRSGRGSPDLRRFGRVPDALALRAVGPGPAHRDALRHGAAGAFHGWAGRHRHGCRRGPGHGHRLPLRPRRSRWPCWTPPIRTIAAYRDRPRWAAIMRRGMHADHSWDGPAATLRGRLRGAPGTRADRTRPSPAESCWAYSRTRKASSSAPPCGS